MAPPLPPQARSRPSLQRPPPPPPHLRAVATPVATATATATAESHCDAHACPHRHRLSPPRRRDACPHRHRDAHGHRNTGTDSRPHGHPTARPQGRARGDVLGGRVGRPAGHVPRKGGGHRRVLWGTLRHQRARPQPPHRRRCGGAAGSAGNGVRQPDSDSPGKVHRGFDLHPPNQGAGRDRAALLRGLPGSHHGRPGPGAEVVERGGGGVRRPPLSRLDGRKHARRSATHWRGGRASTRKPARRNAADLVDSTVAGPSERLRRSRSALPSGSGADIRETPESPRRSRWYVRALLAMGRLGGHLADRRARATSPTC